MEYDTCGCGIVPRFFGTMERLNFVTYQSHLKMFLDAIFLEYIPNMEMVHPKNYTNKRREALIHSIRDMHRVMVLHCNTKPGNIIIVQDDPKGCGLVRL